VVGWEWAVTGWEWAMAARIGGLGGGVGVPLCSQLAKSKMSPG
jgi:hypothetical protein